VTADFPDRPWNLLALVNSLFGFEYGHGATALSSPSQVHPQNINVTTNATGGTTTTTYFVPSPVLPMLRPLNGVLPPSVINKANSVLKPIVDRPDRTARCRPERCLHELFLGWRSCFLDDLEPYTAFHEAAHSGHFVPIFYRYRGG
jgi:hypothetical protein